jgi:Fe2+ or Zn2+ uptake regulation protein
VTSPIKRNTRQRGAVGVLLDEVEGFHSAQDLHAMLRSRGERVGLTTVYRTLQGLADAGEIDVMRPPGGEHLYRRCSQGHHHHLVCRSCGRTVEVEGPAVESWADRVAEKHGFADVSHTLEIFGTCPQKIGGVKLYADRLPVALRQLLTDLAVVIWVYAWVRAGLWVHDLVLKLGVPGQKLEGAGTGLADNLADAGGKVGRVPLVGDELTAPFTKAAEAARSLAEAGREQQSIVGKLALVLALLLVAVPLGLILFVWLPARVKWMRRAGLAKAARDEPAGRDLLALRALASQPLNRLTKIGPDIARSWRDGDPSAVDALAALELKDLGLRPSGRRR